MQKPDKILFRVKVGVIGQMIKCFLFCFQRNNMQRNNNDTRPNKCNDYTLFIIRVRRRFV